MWVKRVYVKNDLDIEDGFGMFYLKQIVDIGFRICFKYV